MEFSNFQLLTRLILTAIKFPAVWIFNKTKEILWEDETSTTYNLWKIQHTIL